MNPSDYNTYYVNAMLVLTLISAFVYFTGSSKRVAQESYNAGIFLLLTVVMVWFIGTRPLSGVFVDMITYSQKYEAAGSGISVYPEDLAFDWLMRAMAPNFSVETFFLVCAGLYVIPLSLAAQIMHGRWAFPALLALLGSFSFFSYGVNGVRSGIAASLTILAFALHRRWALTYPIAIFAGLFHRSLFITITFFVITKWVKSVYLYSAFWFFCLIVSIFNGAETAAFILSFLGDGEDQRFSNYLLGQGDDKGGFRLDFILYSIIPVIISHLFATKEGVKGETYRRFLCTYLATNGFWLLCMYAAFSNRFAYLSWCILPLVIISAHLTESNKVNVVQKHLPPYSIPVLSTALMAHFAFTYFMFMIYYR